MIFYTKDYSYIAWFYEINYSNIGFDSYIHNRNYCRKKPLYTRVDVFKYTDLPHLAYHWV